VVSRALLGDALLPGALRLRPPVRASLATISASISLGYFGKGPALHLLAWKKLDGRCNSAEDCGTLLKLIEAVGALSSITA